METNNCKRRRVYEEEVDDRITSLPDSILVHILSFLPTKDAVRTVLVPRFRHLLNFLPTFSFDHCLYHDCSNKDYYNGPVFEEKFLNFVRHVLTLHVNATIDKFLLKLQLNFFYCKLASYDADYEYYANREKRMASEVDSWVHFAMRKKVKVLDLDFSGCSLIEADASYRLPSVVFGGKYLTDLKLTACEIKPESQIQLNCLKQLLLKGIVLKEEIINQILRGCNVLEELSLIGCYDLHRLAFRNPSIKSLILNLYKQTQRIEISCPNVELLYIAGFIDLVDLVDVSSNAVSSLSFSYGFKCSRLLTFCGFVPIFLLVCSEIIELSQKVFTLWQLINEPGPFFGWKCLEFSILLSKWHHPGISCLLGNSPYLETLSIYIFPGWHHIYMKAMVLEKLEISTQKTLRPSRQAFIFSEAQKDNFSTEQRLELSQKLLSLPRASTSAVIHFS
ncbi:hypothetical protein CRYUN_Cryun17cG0052100 [Craigia yunnanensis]